MAEEEVAVDHSSPSLLLLWMLGTPPQHLDLTCSRFLIGETKPTMPLP
jgi:hypothetical protein